MIILDSIKLELKKTMHLPFFAAGVFGIIFLCLTGTAYVDEKMKEVTILELIFSKESARIVAEQNISYVLLMIRGCGKWFMIFVPSFSVIGYQLITYSENEKGKCRLLLMREGIAVYCVSKLVSIMIVSGLTVCTGYVFFLLILHCFLGNILVQNSEGVLTVIEAMGFNSGGNFVLVCLVGTFLFGMFISLPGFFAGIFFRDRYMLVCLPVLMEYLIMQLYNVMIEKKSDYSDKINNFKFSNFLSGGQFNSWYVTFIFGTIIALFLLVLFVVVTKSRKRRGINA